MTKVVSRSALMAVMTLALSGCAQFSADGGMAPVQTFIADEIGKDTIKVSTPADQSAVDGRVASLLAGTLSSDNAVQVALLNNKGLQARFNEIGISEADFIQAGTLPNPQVSLARFATTGVVEWEYQMLLNVFALFTIERRMQIAQDRLKQSQFAAIQATLQLAAETRRAWYRAVAAEQTLAYLDEAKLSADALSELTVKLGETGAVNRINQAREHAFTAELGAQLAGNRLAARKARDQLARLMGLWGRDLQFRLPRELKKLPGRPMGVDDVERDAVTQRVDLIMARMEISVLSRDLDLTEDTKYITMLELFGLGKTEKSKSVEDGKRKTEVEQWRGLELEFQIPIFDRGDARLRRAEQSYMRAVNLLIEKAVDIRSEVRVAYQTYRGSYDIARHYEVNILPLRRIISEEMLLEYNGMLSDLSQLLRDQRDRISSNIAAIDARRDFWLANVDLHAGIIGGGAAEGGGMATTMAAASGGGQGH